MQNLEPVWATHKMVWKDGYTVYIGDQGTQSGGFNGNPEPDTVQSWEHPLDREQWIAYSTSEGGAKLIPINCITENE